VFHSAQTVHYTSVSPCAAEGTVPPKR
jgi:hypothetical protein